MPNCDFYALGEDLRSVVGFVFAQPGWRLVELSSEPDRELREFRTEAELRASFPALEAQAAAPTFQLYCESMGGAITRRRIEFRPGAVHGASFRYESAGWGLIQLYLGFLRDGRLSPSHTNHNSVQRARSWEGLGARELGPVEAWDWTEVTRISRRLNRFIHACSAEKEGSRPILPAALRARASGLVVLASH